MDATQNSVHWLGSSLSDMDQMQTLFVVGGNIRKEQPILAHRLRKAALNGAKLHYLNPIQIDLNHSGEQDICTPGEMAGRLAAVAKAAGVKASDGAASLLGAAKVDASAKQTAANLKAADGAMVMLGGYGSGPPGLRTAVYHRCCNWLKRPARSSQFCQHRPTRLAPSLPVRYLIFNLEAEPQIVPDWMPCRC